MNRNDNSGPKQIGDLLGNVMPRGVQRAVAKREAAAALTPKERRLLNANGELIEQPGSIEDAAFVHIALCQVALPRSKKAVQGQDVFERKSGTTSVRVEAGALWDGKDWVKQPIPYGTNPRLLMAHMNTFAVRERTKVIPLGDSWRDLLATLGKGASGGKTGALTRMKSDLRAIAACKLRLGYVRDGRAHTFSGDPVDEVQLWMGGDANQLSLFPETLTFSDKYYNALTDGRTAVPVDMRAMLALSGSALAMDIYVMLAERLHRMTGRGVVLYWHHLRAQFGQEYTGADAASTFKRNFLTAFKQVQLAYPQAKARIVDSGLLLITSAPAIAKAK